LALKAVLTKEGFESLADPVKAEYEEKDGAYVLQVDEVDGLVLENVGGLKQTISALRKEVDDHKGKLKAFGDIDPAKARKAIEQHVDLATMTPNDKVKAQVDAVAQQLSEKHQAELSKAIDENKSLSTQLEEALITAVATQALSEQHADVELLLPHVRSATRMVKDPTSGKFVARILNPDGQSHRITGKSGSQDPMSISEFVATDLKKKYPAGFGATQASGSGAETRGGGGGGGGTPAYQLSKADAQDPQKYRAARDAAKKAGRPLQILQT